MLQEEEQRALKQIKVTKAKTERIKQIMADKEEKIKFKSDHEDFLSQENELQKSKIITQKVKS